MEDFNKETKYLRAQRTRGLLKEILWKLNVVHYCNFFFGNP